MTHHRWVVTLPCHEVSAGSQEGTAPSAEAVLRRVGVPASWTSSGPGHLVSPSPVISFVVISAPTVTCPISSTNDHRSGLFRSPLLLVDIRNESLPIHRGFIARVFNWKVVARRFVGS